MFSGFSVLLRRSLLVILVTVLFSTTSLCQGTFSEQDRKKGHEILKDLKQDLKEYYFDPTFHGIDIEPIFAKADQLLDTAKSTNDMWEILAQVMMILDDSHTLFVPPARKYSPFYGWEMKMVGDQCFVSLVEPGTDADSKGMRPGDKVLSIGGVAPSRNNMWVLSYLYEELRPANGKHVVLQSPKGERKEFDAMARLKEYNYMADMNEEWFFRGADYSRWKYLSANVFVEITPELVIWKYPTFLGSGQNAADSVKKIKNYKKMILDLRGNGGGYIDTMVEMLGYFFDQNVAVAEERRKGKTKKIKVQNQGNYRFKGDLIVLVDSETASAAEMFARVIQLEKRGVIIGDQTAGAVVGARSFRNSHISVVDFVMSDGNRLEKVGVKPDKMMTPAALDLAEFKDPVLSAAAAELGVKLDPAEAGKFFLIDWKKLPK